ncbi:MAG TPA: hypothetical protein VHM89_06535 [Acidimicrobiales bacterium]|nr:hypothetical protein [Acidimicrobiales bacterium]
MPSYDRRPAELLELVKGLRASDGPIEELAVMESGLADYATQRNQGLEAVRAMAVEAGRADRAGDYATALEWVRLGVVTSLTQLLDGVTEPSHRAWLVREKALVEDDRCLEQLARLDLGGARDRMVALVRNLEAMITALDAKWMTASDEDRRVEDIERDAARRMNEALRRAVDEALPLYQRLGNHLGSFIDEAAKVPDQINEALVEILVTKAGIPRDTALLITQISSPGKDSFEQAKQLGIPAATFAKALPFLTPDAGMWVSDTVKALLGKDAAALLTMCNEARKVVVMYLIGNYAEARQAFLNQLPNQGVILTTLSRARHDVDDFIQRNGVDVARKLVDDVRSGLDRWAADQPTDGLKADAATFAAAVKEGWAGYLAEMEKTFDTFVRENSGRFFGPVSSDTVEAGLHPSEWNGVRDGIVGLRLDDRLREWRAQAMAVEPGVLSAFRQISGHVAGLPIPVQAALRQALDTIERDFLAEVNATTRETASTFDAAEQTASAAKVTELFDRARLEAALRV